MSDREEDQASLLVPLPSPAATAGIALGDLLRRRQSSRRFGAGPLHLSAVAGLLWAAQGATGRDDRRVTPSAGGLYPLDLLLVAGMINGLAAGIYRYRPASHGLAPVASGEFRPALAAATWGQDCIADAPATVVVAATYRRTILKYGERGVRYAQLEAGHAAQNLCLMATALGLSTVVVGAFDDAAVGRLLRLEPDETPLVLLPVGAASQSSAAPAPQAPR